MSEVVDVAIHLMQNISIQGESTSSLSWDDDADTQSADEAW